MLPATSLKHLCSLLALVFAAAVAAEDAAHSKLIGTALPEWSVTDWIHSAPLSLEQLRGQVVLVRWWTGPGCPYCSASAPYLNRWHQQYRSQGLVVLGFYHHKSDEPWTRAQVARLAAQLGFRFPIAIDPEWRTLKRWWLDGQDRTATSVSFLIDRQGILRYVHPGLAYSPEEAVEIESHIQRLVAD